jgi:hypothetical protein
LRNIPVELYRLPKDGSKWKAIAHDRQSIADWLATFGDGDGTRIFPSIHSMMRRFAWSHGKICYLLADLKELKLLESTGKLSREHGTRIRRMTPNAFLKTEVQHSVETGIQNSGQKFNIHEQQSRIEEQESNLTLDATVTLQSPNRHKGSKPPASPPADPRYQDSYRIAYESFQGKHGIPPAWNGRDQKGLKTLLRSNQAITPAEFSRRWAFYLASTESFTLRQGHSLGYFCSRFDVFIDGPITSAGKEQISAEEITRTNLRTAGLIQ